MAQTHAGSTSPRTSTARASASASSSTPAPTYGADVLVLGADLARQGDPDDRPRARTAAGAARFIGTDYDVADGPRARGAREADRGPRLLPVPGRARRARGAPGRRAALDALFLELMARAPRRVARRWPTSVSGRRASRSTSCSATTTRPSSGPMLDEAPWATHAEGRVVTLDDDHELISWGYSNITPWHSHREQTEEELGGVDRGDGRPAAAIRSGRSSTSTSRRSARGLDEAPVLDENADRPAVARPGQVRARSGARRSATVELERSSRSLGLHGHIHESAGIRRLGRTIAINPGSDYATGVAQRGAHHARARQGRDPPAGPGLTVAARSRAGTSSSPIDVGTSGARAAAFDLDGRRLLEVRRAYPTALAAAGLGRAGSAGRWRSAALGALAGPGRAGSGPRRRASGRSG